MADAKHYWTAVPKSVFEKNIRTEHGKVYYAFHGEEMGYSDNVG